MNLEICMSNGTQFFSLFILLADISITKDGMEFFCYHNLNLHFGFHVALEQINFIFSL